MAAQLIDGVALSQELRDQFAQDCTWTKHRQSLSPALSHLSATPVPHGRFQFNF